jgi:glucosamine-6-phosphate deaminase
MEITREELFRWCSLPVEQLQDHPERKINLIIKEDRPTAMRLIGNMMADEIAENNRQGRITKWILPAGPTDEYDVLIERVNRERISMKNLHVFHMDDFLDGKAGLILWQIPMRAWKAL